MKNFGSTSGLTVLAEDQATPANGMVAHVTSSYNSGYQNGDIKGAFLSDTDDTDLVGGTDADRSVNGNDLTVNGTVTRSPVATGADLVAYSGFSASSYLEQPYNPDLDFGTGDFCMMGWVNTADTIGDIVTRVNVSGDTPWFGVAIVSGIPRIFVVDPGTNSCEATTNVSNSTWAFICGVRRSGVLEIFANGNLENTLANTSNLDSTDALLTVGNRASGNNPLSGSLALWRISATAPTAEQIAKIYEDEKVLFQENAQASLAGTSDAVTALAYDEGTQELLVGTSQNTSVFRGLRRVETISGSASAISASNGLRVIED